MQCSPNFLSSTNKIEKKFSRGEICVANFIPPANGASQGNYFLPQSYKLAVFEEKIVLKTALAAKVANFFQMVFDSG